MNTGRKTVSEIRAAIVSFKELEEDARSNGLSETAEMARNRRLMLEWVLEE